VRAGLLVLVETALLRRTVTVLKLTRTKMTSLVSRLSSTFLQCEKLVAQINEG
jgi:hypothetical protein